MKEKLLNKIKNKEAVIGVVGVGYVGLPLIMRFAQVGFKSVGFDVDQSKIDSLLKSQSYISHISHEQVANVVKTGLIDATNDFSRVGEVDVLILCVPTPLNKYREPDLSYVINTIESLLPHMRKGQLLSLESTTYPGTTDEELATRLQAKGFTVGEDAFLVYSPEREDPANPDFETATIPKVCGGYTPACSELGVALYESVINKVVSVSSTRAAEMTKLLENIHRAVNIGLVNEMKIVADKMDINIHEVIDAAATKPFGFVAYYPGPGLGGHCIPIDPFYLTWKAREYGMHTRFIELAGEINGDMPKWVINKTMLALNDLNKPLKGSKVLVLGIAYKKNVGDMRESPSVELMELLESKGALVEYSDPHVPEFPKMREHTFNLSSIELTSQNVAKFDVVIVATAHKAFDYELIREHAKLIVDTRGVYKYDNASHIVKA